jgi:hypothetical protein
MPGGGRGPDRSGKGGKPAPLRSIHPGGRSQSGCARAAAELATGEIEWLARRYEAEDATGCDLIIAATNDREVNQAVFEEASRRSILCATPPTIRRCATSSSVRSCSGAICRLPFRPRGRVRRWRSACGARSTRNSRRIWERGSRTWDSCAGKSCRRCLRGRNAKLCYTSLRIARFVVRRAARREPLPPLEPKNTSQRCRSEQGGGRQGLPGGRRAQATRIC